MIPRYHGRWLIKPLLVVDVQSEVTTTVLIQWDGDHHQYNVREVGAIGPVHKFGRNGIRRWLKEVKAEPVDGQQPVA